MYGCMGTLPSTGMEPWVKPSVFSCADVERRKNPVCGFITPLEGSEADEHRKPEVGHGPLQLSQPGAGLGGRGGS